MSRPSIRVNPWKSMWTRPRATVRVLVEKDPRYSVVALAALLGVGQTLDRASFQSVGDALSLPFILGVALVLGPLFGILTLYVGAALVHFSGRWIGGRAPAEPVRTALAWGGLPAVAALALWVPALAAFREELFTTATPRLASSPELALGMLGFSVAAIVLGIWSIVLVLKAIGEVQGFSAWKALGNLVLALLVLVVPAVVFGIAAAIMVPRL